MAKPSNTLKQVLAIQTTANSKLAYCIPIWKQQP